MRLGDRVRAEMEDRGGEHRACPAFRHAFDEVAEIADPSAGDDRDADRVGDGTGEFEVVSSLRPVTVHRGDEQLSRTKLCDVFGIFNRVNPGRLAPAMGEYLSTSRFRSC